MAEDLERQIRKFAKKMNAVSKTATPRAASSALNKTSKRIQTPVVRSVSKKYKIKQKIIRKRFRITRATPKKQRVKIYGYVRPVALVRLINTRTLLNRARGGTNKRGVRAGGKQYDGAFINVLRKSGRFHVLRRLGNARYPLEVLKLDISQGFEDNLKIHSESKLKNEFPKLLMHELNYRYSKIKEK